MTTRPPRVTHAYDGDLVLFLIGVRLHQPWRLGVVRRVLAAMPRMIAELEADRAAAERDGTPGQGFLGARYLLDGGHPTVLQYWRSTEDLYRYAADPDLEHRPAWKAFYGYAASAPSAVTIWHETYAVPAGGHESIYAGPASFGLASLAGSVPVAQRGERARQRMAS
ncbi:protein of unknown function [Nocardioides scoriae]|uniref:DUF4188 domain-containing protein n=1 Tax=Nocardioides scoriae TaxID=642780 RepID=A0A1H1TL46_9ACTN|nr:DUF4188 domain-containing protein [Nocardioides scoriae]SDS60902.1 protein of unknown function [Nocardioides scoriae]